MSEKYKDDTQESNNEKREQLSRYEMVKRIHTMLQMLRIVLTLLRQVV